MAELEFLAGAAGAGIIASDLAHVTLEWLLRRRRGIRRIGANIQPALNTAQHIVKRGVLKLHVLQRRGLRLLQRLHFLFGTNLYGHQGARHLALHRLEHLAKHLEGLALVLLLRVLLRIAAQMDALTQMIEHGQMLDEVRDAGTEEGLVGYAFVSRYVDAWHVMNVAVAADHRRRGIATTITVPAAPGATVEHVYAAWRQAYAQAPFVQILPSGETPDTAHVVGTNRIDISAVHDPRTGNFVITSAEDNLMKGASGQAVQIMNLWFGFEETAGLV